MVIENGRSSMYCTKCGIAVDEKANFCPDCGNPTGRNAFSTRAYPKLSRPREDRKIAGVCAGAGRDRLHCVLDRDAERSPAASRGAYATGGRARLSTRIVAAMQANRMAALTYSLIY